MSRDEFIGKLNMLYVGDKNCLEELLTVYDELTREKERLLEIARKMHLYIFLHSGDEEGIYNELGLTEEENIMMGYYKCPTSITLKGSDEEK